MNSKQTIGQPALCVSSRHHFNTHTWLHRPMPSSWEWEQEKQSKRLAGLEILLGVLTERYTRRKIVSDREGHMHTRKDANEFPATSRSPFCAAFHRRARKSSASARLKVGIGPPEGRGTLALAALMLLCGKYHRRCIER